MSAVPAPRWAVSFADLLLLLLGCFVMLNAMQAARHGSAAAAAPAPGAGEYRAADLFQPGEALLKPEALARLQAEGRRLAGRPLRIVSTGSAEAGSRLDRFELSAARAAAVGRALQQGGVREGDVAIAMAEAASPAESQHLAISQR
ncbi:MAG: OmpA family protein [Sphingomonadaceae bacterium]|nr:OmpA family protein [Sphingomonadaceae bacterium]